MNNQYLYIIICGLFVAAIIYILYRTFFSTSSQMQDTFEVEPNTVNPGDYDFGISPPGSLVDQGSFTTVMDDYEYS